VTLALAALAVCPPQSVYLTALQWPQPLPILLIGLLQGLIALRWHNWLRALAALGILLSAAALQWHWLLLAAWRSYRSTRHTIAGLDQIVGGMLVLLAALLVSLTKLGVPQRLLARLRKTANAAAMAELVIEAQSADLANPAAPLRSEGSSP
jgi:hypothetical protein